MNKADLLDALEGRLGSRKAAADAVEAVVDIIIREVAAGGKVGITGFGTFERAERAPRTGRNPRTGETVRIEQTTVPKFRPGTQFREVVADPDLLPADGLAGARAAVAARRAAEPDTEVVAERGAATDADADAAAVKKAKKDKADKPEKGKDAKKSKKAKKAKKG